MAALFLNRLNNAIKQFEYRIFTILFKQRPSEEWCLVGVAPPIPQQPKQFSLKDIIGDGFLWAVPRSRRTLEKRQKRRFGDPYYVWKMLEPRTTIRTCNTCGDDYVIGQLCPTCYKKVIDETKEMQETIQQELKLEPIDKEIVVLYDGEKQEKPDEFWQGKRIVEMKKTRPQWFSKNLLQQTTQQPATTSDVKPSDLG